MLNPALIVKVLSPSTEAYDRGEKFEHYRNLESVADYVMIRQDRLRVEHYSRQPDDRWLLTVLRQVQDVLVLPSLDCRLALVDIYAKVDL